MLYSGPITLSRAKILPRFSGKVQRTPAGDTVTSPSATGRLQEARIADIRALSQGQAAAVPMIRPIRPVALGFPGKWRSLGLAETIPCPLPFITMSQRSTRPAPVVIIAYGAFLILIGLLGFLSNPEKAKTALISGGTFGTLSIVLGLLAARGWKPAATVMLVVASLLSGIFVWRASASWLAVASGAADKFTAAVLISAMLAASLALIAYLLLARRRPAV
jgi:hypothetical protein